VYQALGEYDKARELLEQALESNLTHFGASHPTVAISQSNLASVYKDLGEYDKARGLWQKAYATFREKLGEEHPYTQKVKGFLGL
jgi:tetratricopeptide (TPR) repeat protein